jgi:DNA polymerase IV
LETTILHVDMDAFFAAVEQHDHPEYRGKPVVVGAPPDKRGVVSAASYEAREFGIHSAMPSREAYRRCPKAVFLPVNGKRYHEVSRHVFRIFERFTPLVEPLSIDEAFLDVSGVHRLFGTGPEIAETIRGTIRDETGLTASVGVAHNKFLAKLASDLDKPDGLTVVPRAHREILLFLASLPVERIWGVGRMTRTLLHDHGIRTIGELQTVPERRLAGIVGKHGARHLQRLALGEDARELELTRVEKSISKEHTFGVDCSCGETLESVLLDLVDEVGSRLRGAGKYASLIRLKLRWQGFDTITRQRRLEQPCCDDFALREAALALFREQERSRPVRLIGFGVSKLCDRRAEQLTLFASESEKRDRKERLSRTVDRIRSRYGDDSIERASGIRGS